MSYVFLCGGGTVVVFCSFGGSCCLVCVFVCVC